MTTSLSFYNSYVRQYLHLLLPMILGSLLVWTIGFLDTFIASFFDTGSISYIGYCRRAIRYSSVISNAICVIYFPILSKLNEKKNDDEYKQNFHKGFQSIFTLNLFVSLFILTCSKSIMTLLFQRGNFTASDTAMVSHLLLNYSLVLIFAPTGAFLANAYYSMRKMKLANILSAISSCINLIFNCLLGFYWGVFGLATASSIAFFIGNALQIFFLHSFFKGSFLQDVIKGLLPPILVGSISVILLLFLKKIISHFLSVGNLFLDTFLMLSISFFGYAIIFSLLCRLFRVEVVLEVYQKSWAAVKRLRLK